MARVTEECGFSAFFRYDHLMAFGGDGLPGPTDSWVTLGGLARETTRVRLGTLVTSMTFRFPGMLAIAVAQVDAMSGGRVELGLGGGWFDREHLAHAVPFPPTRQRLQRLEEQLQILSGMWGTPVGEKFSHKGEHYTVVDSPGLPKPTQRPARRSSSVVPAPESHRSWRPATPTSSTCLSTLWPWPPTATGGSAELASRKAGPRTVSSTRQR